MIQDISFRDKARTFWHVQRVKRLVRDRLGTSVQCLVSVRETICQEPGCEGPATDVRIVMLNFKEIRGTIHKSASDVSEADIASLL